MRDEHLEEVAAGEGQRAQHALERLEVHPELRDHEAAQCMDAKRRIEGERTGVAGIERCAGLARDQGGPSGTG